MNDTHWTTIRLHRSSRRTHRYLELLATASAPFPGPSTASRSQESILDLLDRLAAVLNLPLLSGETYNLESEIRDLVFTSPPDKYPELIAVTGSKLLMLRSAPPFPGRGVLDSWGLPVMGTPLGLCIQPVGFLDAREVVLLTRAEGELRETRLALPGPHPFPSVVRHESRSRKCSSIGRDVSRAGSPHEIEVRRIVKEGQRPVYELRLRLHPAAPWKVLHQSTHPLHNPVFDGKTLFFSARSSEIMAVSRPFDLQHKRPHTVFVLDTPSPIQGLAPYPMSEGPALIAATADGTVFAVDPATRSLRWKYDTGHAVSAVAFFASEKQPTLALGSPDGLLEFLHPVDRPKTWTLVDSLMAQSGLTYEELITLSRQTTGTEDELSEGTESDPTTPQSAPAAHLPYQPDRPHLRLLALEHLFKQGKGSSEHLNYIMSGLLQAMVTSERDGRVPLSHLIRFLAYQFRQLTTGQGPRKSLTSVVRARYLPLLFNILELLGPRAHGDARRRLERLLRRLKEDWLGPALYHEFSQAHAPALAQATSSFNLRSMVREQLQAAQDADTTELSDAHLLRALAACWRRTIAPLCRTVTIQGVKQALVVRPADSQARPRILGVAREGIRVYQAEVRCHSIRKIQEIPVPDLRRLAVGSAGEDATYIVLVRSEVLETFRLEIEAENCTLLPLDIEGPRVDEPITAMEIFNPALDRLKGVLPLLALGQADGRFRLLSSVGTANGDFQSETGQAGHRTWRCLLEFHSPAPIHHVSFLHWPTEPTLMVAADQLYLFRSLAFRAGSLEFERQTLKLESEITAVNVVPEETPGGTLQPPHLILGLANGQVLAFEPTPGRSHGFQLVWGFRARQAVTTLSHLSMPDGDWHIAATDDGALLMQRFGEAQKRVSVERFPFGINKLYSDNGKPEHILVSSPAGAATLLEVTNDARKELARLADSLQARMGKFALPQRLERATNPILVALAIHLLERHPLEQLLDYARGRRLMALTDERVAATLLKVLLSRAGAEPESRSFAYTFAREVLSETSVPDEVRAHTLLRLGGLLDRLEEAERDLILTPLCFEESEVARAYLLMLEQLWQRFGSLPQDELLWWRAIQSLDRNCNNFQRRQILPTLGILARKLLQLTRANVLSRIRELREMEGSGLYVTELICTALSVPNVLGDEATRRCLEQYAALIQSQSPHELNAELRRRYELLSELEAELPEAEAILPVYEDLLETFDYDQYDHYSRFLVNAPEFMANARGAEVGDTDILGAFAEARAQLLASTPASSSTGDQVTQFQERVRGLSGQADTLLELIRRWIPSPVFEKHVVATVLARWRERIILPEIRRLQSTVELAVKDLRVLLVEGGGLAELSARIHNLGGKALDGLSVGLLPGPDAPYLWESMPEWCRGPIHYGQALEYQTELLIDSNIDELKVTFELSYMDQGRDRTCQVTRSARVIKQEPTSVSEPAFSWREVMPRTFDSLCHGLLRSPAGRLIFFLSEEARERHGLAAEVAEWLEEARDKNKRRTLALDFRAMLEGPPKTIAEEMPRWWLSDRTARELLAHGLISTQRERAELRAEPTQTLERVLHEALEHTSELWLILKPSTRSQLGHPRRNIELAIEWLTTIVTHPSKLVRVIIPGDFALAARLGLAPSPLAGQVDIHDLDRPDPPNSAKAQDEIYQRARQLTGDANLRPSELILRRILAHTGLSLALFRKLVPRLSAHQSDGWLQNDGGNRDTQSEPDELNEFFRSNLSLFSKHFRDTFRALPFYHRLALLAVASSRIKAGRKTLAPGMIVARDIKTNVRSRANRPKQLYRANAVLLNGDVKYLRITVGELQGGLEVAQYQGLNFKVSPSHLLGVLNLDEILNDLKSLRLVKHISDSSGGRYQIAIPLFRRWLVATHPFEPGEEDNLRRVSDDGRLVENIPLAILPELNRRLRSSRQLSDFLTFLGLTREDGGRKEHSSEQLLQRWDALIGMARRMNVWMATPGPETFTTAIREWAASFSGLVEPIRHTLDPNIQALRVDLERLRIPRLRQLAVFGLSSPLNSLRADQLRQVVRRLGSSAAGELDAYPSGALGLVCFSKKDRDALESHLRPPEIQELFGERLLLLSEADLIQTMLADDGRRAVLNILARGGFRFQHLSPYQPLGPLKGKAANVLFVGRENEIDDVLRHPDRQFAIVGSRKIGKTSLLLKLREELCQQSNQKARVLYVDCTTLSSAQVWRSITDGLGLEPVTLSDARLGIRRQLEHLRHPVVLLLDEIDGIYDAARDSNNEEAEHLMWDLRSLAAAGVLRLIIAGYVRTYERRLDPRSAFHNFTTFRRLSELTREAARSLVREPLSSLDIEIASEGLIDLILERTYRVPWIIQLFCNQLIVKLDERLDRQRRFDRRITQEDVEGVSVQIDEELYTHFTSPRVMSAAEQLLLLSMVEAGVRSFDEQEAQSHLEGRFGEEVWSITRFEDLPRILDNLTLTLALTVEGGRYSFPLEMYPTVIKSRLGDVRPRVNRLFRQLRNEGSI